VGPRTGLDTTKNEVVSINQPNYKSPEKYHDTEEIFGYNLILLNYVLLHHVVIRWRLNTYTDVIID